ncbi:MAG: hypothetical protein K2G23_00465, partial [Muribaculaceae bacterium]|nr:hypothetical protein [Muribaculaceae bacterium]
MEKRIKALYIATIIAILAFLGMQVYWLYQRYEYALKNYEEETSVKVSKAMEEYLNIKKGKIGDDNRLQTHVSQYNIDWGEDSVGKTGYTARITSQKYFAHELLGIKEHRKLTPEEQTRAAKIVMEHEELADTRRDTFITTNAPSDGAIWTAFKHYDIEFLSPVTVAEWNSVVDSTGIAQSSKLIQTDTIVWKPFILKHGTVLNPEISIIVPYSEMEKKSIMVNCSFSFSEAMDRMAGSLLVAFLLSVFLIVCLILQIATVLKLSRLDKMRSSFITTMIHELKRPISTLKMCVSGIENDRMIADKETKEELVSATRGALDNLSAYFSKLRDMTFNDVEQIPLNLANVNLRHIVDMVFKGVVIPSDKDVSMLNEIGEDVEVPADYSHLFNILTNLVENAIKYSGEEVEITAAAQSMDNGVAIKISDNGFGITQGELKHIFQRFYRGSRHSGSLPGMGLGLAYVKLLV